MNHQNVIENYGSNGRLQSMVSAGMTTTLQYDASARLSSVSNGFGRSLAYSYDTAGRVAGVKLPDGNTLTYDYDGYNNLVKIHFTDTSVRQYLYENTSFPNALTGLVDESGRRRVTWGYDTAGRPNSSYYGTGTNRITISYSGNQVTTTDARGTVRTRTYGSVAGRTLLVAHQTAATADSAATQWSYSYDANGNPQKVITRTGEVRQFSADSRGRITNAVRAAGTSAQVAAQSTWHPVFRLRTRLVKAGVTTDVSVDNAGRVTQVNRTGSDGSTVTLLQRSYNSQNLLQSQTGPYGASRSYTYDTAGNMTSVTNQLGLVTKFSSYNSHGQAGRIDRPDGTVVLRNYDVRGRLTWHSVNGAVTAFSYDSAGRVYQKTYPDNGWKRRTWDKAGQVASITNHRGETISVGRDAAGKITSRIVYAANNSVASAVYKNYDSRGRLAAIIDAQKNQTTLSYAADARRTALTNPLGHVFSRQLDLLNRTTVTTQPNTTAMRQAGGPATVSVNHQFDSATGFRLSTADTVSVSTGYGKDAFNRRISETGNDAGTRTSARNAAGDAVSTTDARGIAVSYTRDSLGRVTTVTPPAGTTPINITYVSDRSDLLPSKMTDPSGSTSWTYDSQGRLLSKTQYLSGNTSALNITRDDLGRVTTMTYPSGMKVGVSYADDVVSAITVNGVTLLNHIAYLPFSKAASSWSWGNGSTYSRTVDANGRVSAVALGPSTRSCGYDAAGRVTSYSDTSAKGTTAHSLGYDEAGQLTSYSGPEGSFSCAYDTNGNRRSAVQYGTSSSLSYQSGSNRLLSSPRGSYGYDAYGQLVKMSTSTDYVLRSFNGQHMRVRSATWFLDDNCLTTPPGDSSAGLAKGRGAAPPRRIERLTTTRDLPRPARQARPGATANMLPPGCGNYWAQDGNVVYFHADDGSLLGEYDTTNHYNQETIWFNGQPVGAMIGGVLYYVKADHLGTPRSLARPSDNAEVWRWDADPFGNHAPTNPTAGVNVRYDLRMPGQQFEPYGGYFYNWMRDYDPYTGRYLQADPLGLGGGLSRYTYVGGDPLRYTDPFGLNPFGGAVVGAEVGTAILPGVGTVVGGLVGAGVGAWIGWSVVGPLFSTGLPPGFWPGDKGSAEWGRRNGFGARDGKGRFHGIKQGCPGSKATDDFGVNPATGDVVDPSGDVVGNLWDAKPK